MSTEVVSVKGEEFSASAHHAGATIKATLSGNADFASVDAIDMLLKRTHEQAIRHAVGEVVIDMVQLEFMNSSCFKCFVSWITDIQELGAAQQYKVKFVSNGQLHWQKRSLHSLRCFAVELITVTET